MKTIRTTLIAAAAMFFSLAEVRAADRYVAQDGQTPVSPFTNGWANAASNIQEAAAVAGLNDTIWINTGRYLAGPDAVLDDGLTNVVFLNLPLTLQGATGNPADVILDGEGLHRGIMLAHDQNTSDRFFIRELTVSNAVNAGLRLRLPSWWIDRRWTAVMENCVVTGCEVGIRRNSAQGFLSVVLSNVLVRGCSSDGILISTTTSVGGLEAYDCRVEDNVGAGMNLLRGTYVIERPILRRNYGGINAGAGDYTLYNCLIYDNDRTGGTGGGINAYNTTSKFSVRNSTLTGNKGNPGGIAAGGPVVLYNSILYDNYNGTVHRNYYATQDIHFTNSCTYPAKAGWAAGNIEQYPGFADAANKNFRLLRTSHCVDAGTNLSWTQGAVDLDGQSRIDRGGPRIVDMGCYEYAYRGSAIVIR